MASYVESVLTNGESVIYQGKISLWSQALKIILGILLTPLFGLGLLILLDVFLKWWTTELAITNKRVIAKFGLIRRSTVEISISKVESIQVEQSILGRIFNYGSIIISGAGNPQAPVPGISYPLKFRSAFISTQESVI